MKIEENQSKIYWSQGNHESVFFLIIEPVYHETYLKKKNHVGYEGRGKKFRKVLRNLTRLKNISHNLLSPPIYVFKHVKTCFIGITYEYYKIMLW